MFQLKTDTMKKVLLCIYVMMGTLCLSAQSLEMLNPTTA